MCSAAFDASHAFAREGESRFVPDLKSVAMAATEELARRPPSSSSQEYAAADATGPAVSAELTAAVNPISGTMFAVIATRALV